RARNELGANMGKNCCGGNYCFWFNGEWRKNTQRAFRASPRLPPAATGRLALVRSETWPGAPQLPFHQSDRSGQVLCNGTDVPERVHRADNGEHDGALRRFEYHRYLTFAGAYSDLKGASWEWLTYSHLADLSRSVGTTATTSAPPWLCSRRGRILNCHSRPERSQYRSVRSRM